MTCFSEPRSKSNAGDRVDDREPEAPADVRQHQHEAEELGEALNLPAALWSGPWSRAYEIS